MSSVEPRTLPAPIKPRRLVRDLVSGGYSTSDDTYCLDRAYAPSLRGGSISRGHWIATDIRTGKSFEVVDLDRFRELYCAPGGRVPWLVLDMDQGVVRVEPTRAAAVEWARHQYDGRVINREHSGEAWYEYFIGYSRDDCSSVWIARADIVHRHGFNAEQEPWYPYPDAPHDLGPRAARADEESMRA